MCSYDVLLGLMSVFEDLFDIIEYIFLRHLYANFKKQFEGGTFIKNLRMGVAKETYY